MERGSKAMLKSTKFGSKTVFKSLSTSEAKWGGTLRDELDAIVAHLYGLTRAEFEHILGTFPLAVTEDRRAALLAAYEEVKTSGMIQSA
jgi:hypothetical protein